MLAPSLLLAPTVTTAIVVTDADSVARLLPVRLVAKAIRDYISVMSIVRDNPSLHRFEMDTEAGLAFTDYRLGDGVIRLVHTEVPAALNGRGLGSRMVRGVLEAARARGLKVVPVCDFVRSFMRRHPEFDDLAR